MLHNNTVSVRTFSVIKHTQLFSQLADHQIRHKGVCLCWLLTPGLSKGHLVSCITTLVSVFTVTKSDIHWSPIQQEDSDKFLTLTVPLTTIDARQHFETG